MAYAVRRFPGLLALLLFAASAGAAEMPEGSHAEGSYPSAFGTRGFYIGPAMGAAFNAGVSDWTGYGFTPGAQVAHRFAEEKSSSVFAGGLIIGYQVPLQYLVPHWTAPLVLGPEIDINYIGEFRKHDSFTYTTPVGAVAPAGTYHFTTGRDANFLGTVRSHFGYLFADNKAQIYLSGGFAYGGNGGAGSGTVTYTNPLTGTVSTFSRSGSKTRTGGVFGFGGEYSYHSNMDAGIEYMYVTLKSDSHTFTVPGTGNSYFISTDAKGHFSVIRARLTYHF
jgi:hypothetical protein